MATAWRWLVFLLRLEIRMYVGLLRLVARRPDVPDDTTSHAYAGPVSALLWGLAGVSAVELVVLHLLIPWERVRLVADVLGVWGLVWVAGLAGCHHVYPHLTTPQSLRVRNAERRDSVTVPWHLVGSVAVRERGLDSSRSPQLVDDVLHVGVGSRTNVELRLTAPITVTVARREVRVREVRLYADDPRALLRAIEAARAGQQGAGSSTPRPPST